MSPLERNPVHEALENYTCSRCGHAAFDHIDIASYRMSGRDQDTWQWCSGGDGLCDCGLSLDDMIERMRRPLP